MSEFDRFDFEQQIMSCWNVTTDVKDLTEEVIEGNLSKDQIANVLMGLEQLYTIRFDKLFRMFEQGVRERAFQSKNEIEGAKDPKGLLREFVTKFDQETAENVDTQKRYIEQPYTLSPEAMDEITVANLREYRDTLVKEREEDCGKGIHYSGHRTDVIAALDLVLSKFETR